MKLVHVVDSLDAVGGVQTYLQQLVPGLRGRGIESVLVTAAEVPGLDDDGATLPAETIARFDTLLAGERPDACLLHLAPSPAVALAAAARAPTLAFAHDYAMVCPGNARHLHRSNRFCAEGPGLRCFRRAYTERSTNRRPDRLARAYRRAGAWPAAWPSLARVLVASPFVGDVLARDGVPAERIRVVAYPVAPPPAAEPERAADVLFVNRLVAAKGVHVLLRALAGLDGVSVAIAGDGPERPHLESLAAELGVDARFLGWVDGDRRAALLRGCRVFAFPSLWQEPFGIAGVEALAAGIPVVASAVGGVPSWLEDGRGGLLVPPGDPPALAAAIRRVLDEPSLAESLAAAGPQAAERFSLDAHLDLLVPELEAFA
ncbi:MAG: glycosyltransferase family 4 protein [Gaiellaceae bacterium]